MAGKTRRPGADVRRREITDAAIEVFGEKNYNWATTREIAERAGVSERTLFFYFKNKKELYKIAFRQSGQELMDAINRGNPPLDDMRTFIKMGSRNVVAFLKENPYKMKLLIQSVDVTGDPELKDEIGQMVQGMYEYTRSRVEAAQKSGELEKGIKVDSLTVFIMGFNFIVSYMEFFDLDWFKNVDIYSVGDHFANQITLHERKD